MGARSGDVLLQFLVEALVVSSLGGLLGSGLGVGAVMAVAAFTPLPASIGAVSVLGTVLLSGSIGLFFGVVPARRAAQSIRSWPSDACERGGHRDDRMRWPLAAAAA